MPVPAPPPDEATLYDTALRYLARYAATRAGVLQILDRRITRWAHSLTAEQADTDTLAEAVEAAREAARRAADRLEQNGVLNDAAFAAIRARSLARAGRSRRAVAAHLAARGVPPELAAEAAPNHPDLELAGALRLARRRHLGPFARSETSSAPQDHQRALAAMARAGFDAATAQHALRMDRDDAETLLAALQSGALTPS